ncbi:MAG TPA: biotin/lipoyl-binding protein, partial [Stellaceae bacterium]|nr:biotin/lipoyl-binding protein [Stellaceae bacterium]
MTRPHPKIVRLALLVLVPIVVVVIGGMVWLHGGRTVGTEDAYVKTDMAQIAPEVSGRIIEVLVRDHQIVEAGTPLVRLDPEPFQLALDKAEAELDKARTEVETARAQWRETENELREAENRAEYLMREAARQRMLAANGTASITKLDEAQNAAVVARARVAIVKSRLARMLAALGGDPEMSTDEHPLVREKKAERDRAQLDLERTAITAPIGGTAVNVKLQPGE